MPQIFKIFKKYYTNLKAAFSSVESHSIYSILSIANKQIKGGTL